MKKLHLSLLIALFLFPTFTHAFFADVPENHEAYDAISTLRNQHVVEGVYEEGRRVFNPDQEVRTVRSF